LKCLCYVVDIFIAGLLFYVDWQAFYYLIIFNDISWKIAGVSVFMNDDLIFRFL